MKLELAVRREPAKRHQRTHAEPRSEQPLARQMRKLRRYYDRLAQVAARLEGRPAPMPGVTAKLKVAVLMRQTGCTRREAVDQLLRERAAKLSEP